MFTRELSKEVALEKGIETFWEIMFYVVVIYVTFYEISKGYNKQQKKEEDHKNTIISLENKIQKTNDELENIREIYDFKVKDLKSDIQDINNNLEIIIKNSDKFESREKILNEFIDQSSIRNKQITQKIDSLINKLPKDLRKPNI